MKFTRKGDELLYLNTKRFLNILKEIILKNSSNKILKSSVSVEKTRDYQVLI